MRLHRSHRGIVGSSSWINPESGLARILSWVTRQNCAVVLFERDERAEAREKKLPRGVLGLLRRRLERQVRSRSGVDLWIAASSDARFVLQSARASRTFIASTLAEQLNATAAHLQSDGYERVLFLATDVAVTPEALDAAIRQLQGPDTSSVLGESRDGGFYLFGVSCPAVALDWNDVPLHTGRAAADLRRRMVQEGRSLTMLPAAADLDEAGEILGFVADLRRRGLQGVASIVLAGLNPRSFEELSVHLHATTPRAVPPLRGPPSA